MDRVEFLMSNEKKIAQIVKKNVELQNQIKALQTTINNLSQYKPSVPSVPSVPDKK